MVSLKKKRSSLLCTVAFVLCQSLSLLRLVNISIWQSFKKCLRAAQNALEGHMWLAGRSLPTPGLDRSCQSPTALKRPVTVLG